MSQLIMGCRSAHLQRKALSEDITLENLLKFGRAKEAAEDQARRMESSSSVDQVNKLRTRTSKAKASEVKKHSCYLCGGDFPHSGECPAKDKECRQCGKKGHFSRVCRTKKFKNFKFKKHEIRNLQEKSE